MTAYKGTFVYENCEKIQETEIEALVVQGNLVELIVKIDREYINFIYNKQTKTLMFSYDRNEDGEPLYKKSVYKLIRIEYTTIIV